MEATSEGHRPTTRGYRARITICSASPEDLDDERALFLGDVLTTGYYAAAVAGIRPEDAVAVVGAGPVGFFAAQAARLHHPSQVLALDLQRERLELAEGVGAVPVDVSERNAETAVDEATGGRGADVVIEAVGSVAAFETSLGVARSGGTISIVGMYVTETIDLQLGILWTRMLRLIFGGICPVHAWWDRALEAVRSGAIDPEPIVSHRLPLHEAPRGYELFGRREATKVILLP